jgi:hypothetical protein
MMRLPIDLNCLNNISARVIDTIVETKIELSQGFQRGRTELSTT